MKQVLLAAKTGRPTPPIVMWMGDDALAGDIFLWRNRQWVISTVYGTRLCPGSECRKRDIPHHHRPACVVLDHHDSN